MTAQPIRVLVVEDSLTVRQYLCEVLAGDPEISVVGAVGDGKAAIAQCQALRPDVVTMDMILPLMSGLAATEYIMAHCPTPILIVSASFNRGEVFKTMDALAAGAVEALDKPLGGEGDAAWEKHFLATVKLVSRIRPITHPRARLPRLRSYENLSPAPQMVPPGGERGAYRVIAIGASTGGPSAVVKVLRALPCSLGVPILLVLHMAGQFCSAFAEWLDTQSEWPVVQARDGDRIDGAIGRVCIAPPDLHLGVRDGRLFLSAEPERHSCRPSVDVLFESVAREFGPTAIACLLTGMGRDGASGLLDIRRSGGFTIAQDEDSSVVFGMPREAIRLGAAERVLPLDAIGPTMAQLPPAVAGVMRR
ncbi:chemotaxis-specific protein-glutamate methyltransferase CheB [Tahibacter amnicola]|uniref:Protein-glutamate methylesterase/protein-glutamine glutaminase n=1 Tax=Tahibacter amnicola TaxID=2976241 RepID=A0ABY6BC09_9GAMM|nr:chemotaxis-specific protein-glutamate methyltransferase CheB [Tahibacter amnicola]UXI66650.1 chemotaxis-specific protein-glutamate methyltransferase CheB [Tahibacter amnicola]